MGTVIRTVGLAPGRRIDATEVSTAAPPRRRAKPASFLIPLFILSLTIPIIIHVGPLRLSAYRLLLIVMFIPCVVAWLSGRMGKIRAPDIFFLLSTLWGAAALTVIHGGSFALEPAGILLVETFGSYLLARLLIRNAASFEAMVRALFYLVAVIFPFAMFETLTSRPILLELYGSGFTVFGEAIMQPRMGLDRAQGPFEHPILFGVVCSSAFALSYFVLYRKNSSFGNLLRSGVVHIAVGCSLSVGAFVSIATQWCLIVWERQTRNVSRRWVLLGTLFFTAYVVVDILSNRTPIEVFISYLTFNVGNAYNRVLIWHFGTQEVWNNPIFGIGLNEWTRAHWMSTSMDNFWLLIAVRYGLPMFFMFVFGVVSIFFTLGRLQIADAAITACRNGLLITLAGLAVAICTVHLWNASYSLFMFLLGSGLWMLDRATQSAPAQYGHSGKTSVVREPGQLLVREGSKQHDRRPAGLKAK